MDRETRNHVVYAPLKAWALMLLLLLLTATVGHLSASPGTLEVNLALAVGQIALVATFLMQLRTSAMLVRLTALAGVIWASFLFLFTFADFLTR